jgi:hypothetical protein
MNCSYLNRSWIQHRFQVSGDYYDAIRFIDHKIIVLDY